MRTIARHALNRFVLDQVGSINPETESKLGRIAAMQVKKAAFALGIQRCSISQSGRQYTMFNVGEAEAVWEWLSSNKKVSETLCKAYHRLEQRYWQWELTGGNWELVPVERKSKVLPGQLRF